ncbi:MAG: AraC family transcriptional regulator of adaptative response / DNA-3-methyladenine glycosylase II [Planctomycetota bacterium]|jgi:AraC family transcriptional regulator of adaptative response / DNA-3-methyladenine glycosylase II
MRRTLSPVQSTDPDTCYRALVSRDGRFDGRFFATVKTTGIYCRPICPAPKPKRKNVDFVPTAAAAEVAGFRACLRCRPDSAPGSSDWLGSSALISRAIRKINDGALNLGSVKDLSEQLGITSRHLSRLFREELGASPLEFAQTLRAHGARRLLEQTGMKMTDVAFAAGYGSIRSFNAEMRTRFEHTPAELRKRAGVRSVPGECTIRLRIPYRPPLAWEAILAHLQVRSIAGVERVVNGTYQRTVRQEGASGRITVSNAAQSNALIVALDLPVSRGMTGLLERVRGLFDLRADPLQIADDLAGARELAPLIAKYPGLRVVGAWDGFELALRAILGQQVSLKGATTLLSRLATLCGDSVEFTDSGLAHLFPTPEQVVNADLSSLGVPRARITALKGLAQAVVTGWLDLDCGADPEQTRARLLEIAGVGPWTAEYILMRGLRNPDAFPAGDLVLRKALSKDTKPLSTRDLENRSAAWRPWRAYAAMWLWKGMADRI